MSRAAVRNPGGQRTASKETRRLQLIQATIRSIAKNGLSDTTVATVAAEAKLSQGIVNLHFQSKERLLVETLRFVADEYRDAWEKALEEAGPSPAEQLEALINVDFEPTVFAPNKVAVWFAFWSETKSRPTYRKLCAERDRRYDRKLNEIVTALIRDGHYDHLDPDCVTEGLSAVGAGLWLDLLVSPRAISRDKARQIGRTLLVQMFPDHFKP
ncbi:TetR family transcriptional regulator C-terminal domain-containing protein [Elongatibacter sediminis]|uniref:TetR family transcriptional regulator C-terminal domain-containing protein n=1 Tax=Elongatibacter sediminis TaxID=3119006 RepID=A0AAW9RHA1_9GAMM